MTEITLFPLIADLHTSGRLRTRFAPSPTGWLHLGHAYSALSAWRACGCSPDAFFLRMDDLDTGRTRSEFIEQITDDLKWLGLSWQTEPVFQSQRLNAYEAALQQLESCGLIYPCYLTRKQAQSFLHAPHITEDGLVPAPSTRDRQQATPAEQKNRQTPVWRLDSFAALKQTGPLVWRDHKGTHHHVNPAEFGDVVIAGRNSPASYHLSCVIDDAHANITLVVRGADLAPVTQIHRLLQAVLDLPSPIYLHHRLLTDDKGKRLAKRHDSLSLKQLRSDGITPEKLLEMLPDFII